MQLTAARKSCLLSLDAFAMLKIKEISSHKLKMKNIAFANILYIEFRSVFMIRRLLNNPSSNLK